MSNAERTNFAFDLYSFSNEEWGSESAPPSVTRPAVDPYWYLQFLTENYDWNDPEWTTKKHRGKRACRFIPIMKQRPGSKKRHDLVESGYFMVVSPIDYRRMTRHEDGSVKHWTLKIDRDKKTDAVVKIYARRCGRGDEPHTVMAHREILGCLLSKHVVDHFNGWGLDNRRANLGHVSHSENVTNPSGSRRRKYDLPQGVEPIYRKGEVRFGGIRAERYGKKDPITGRRRVRYIRSKRQWKTPAPAALWYKNQLKRKYGIRPWARNPTTATYPFFPPKLESTPSRRSIRLRNNVPKQQASRKERQLADIPF